MQLFNADCLDAMKNLEDSSIDLVLTDPPYNLGKFMENRDTNLAKMRDNFFCAAGWDNLSYEQWKDSMESFLSECSRVMKKGASMIMFMSLIRIETIVRIAENYGFYYKTTGIWHKLNPMPRNMNLHFINSTEAWLYFTYKTRTGTFNNNGKVLHDFIETSLTTSKEKKYGKHPTQKPLELINRLVKILSNKNDVILDPFMGTGTTGIAALENERNFIGIEIEKKYFDIAQQRIKDVAHETESN